MSTNAWKRAAAAVVRRCSRPARRLSPTPARLTPAQEARGAAVDAARLRVLQRRSPERPVQPRRDLERPPLGAADRVPVGRLGLRRAATPTARPTCSPSGARGRPTTAARAGARGRACSSRAAATASLTARRSAPRSTAASTRPPKCVAFLSAAIQHRPERHQRPRRRVPRPLLGRVPRRGSPAPAGSRRSTDTTQIAVTGDCKRDRLRHRREAVRHFKGADEAPRARARTSATRRSRPDSRPRPRLRRPRWHLPLAARAAAGEADRPRRPNPAYNDVKRRVLAYERPQWRAHADRVQGPRPQAADHQQAPQRHVGNGDSRNPVIGNSGYYVDIRVRRQQPLASNAARRVRRPQRQRPTLPIHGRARPHARAVGRGKGRAGPGRRQQPEHELLRELHPVRLACPAGAPRGAAPGLHALARARLETA